MDRGLMICMMDPKDSKILEVVCQPPIFTKLSYLIWILELHLQIYRFDLNYL